MPFILCVSILYFSCKRDLSFSEELLINTQGKVLDAFTKISEPSSRDFKLIVANIKSVENKTSFLTNYTKKNGFPVWTKVIASSGNLYGAQARSTSDTTNSKGFFLIPLIDTVTREVKAYIACEKKSDSAFVYKTYNKADILNAIPADSQKVNIRPILSVFAYFERVINGKNQSTFTVQQTTYTFNNTTISLLDLASANKSASISSNISLHRAESLIAGCTRELLAIIVVNDENGNFADVRLVWSDCLTLPSVTVIASTGSGNSGSSGSGGSIGGSNSGSNGGNSSGSNGGNPPPNNGGNPPNNPNDPNNGAGIPVGGSGLSNPIGWYSAVFENWWLELSNSGLVVMLDNLNNLLSNTLTPQQLTWLNDNKEKAQRIYVYLTTSTLNAEEKKALVVMHINKMMTDPAYLAFVNAHDASNTNSAVWWEDEEWLITTDQPFSYPDFICNVPDKPVINNGVDVGDISPTTPPSANSRLIAKTQNRGNTEDMQHGTNGNTTGITNTFLLQCPDWFLFEKMRGLLTTFSAFNSNLRSVGNAMIDKFQQKTGGTYSNSSLNNEVSASSDLSNFLKKFGEELNSRLKNSGGNINSISPIDLSTRPVFNGLYNKFHGLTILLNDTEYTEIQLDNFSIDNLGNWSADVTVIIHDHFGLDKHDALEYQGWHDGFAAWWILQNTRDYVPFETIVTVRKNLKGNFN